LTLAAVLSVAMSTLSSSVGSSASTFITDLWPSGKSLDSAESPNDDIQSQKLSWLSKLATLVFGLLQLLVALLVAWIPQLQVQSIINQVLTFSGFASGIVLGIFLLTITNRKIAPASLAIAMIAAVIVTSCLIFAPEQSSWRMPGTTSAVISSVTTAVVAILVQACTELMRSPKPNSPTRSPEP
jgi:Na+/proline symporter